MGFSAWYYTANPITIRIQSRGATTEFFVGNHLYVLPEPIAVNRITLSVWHGAFPQRIHSLEWGEGNEEAISSRAIRFKASIQGAASVSGDWYSDQVPSEEIASVPVSLHNSPWVTLNISLRSLQGVKLQLQGPDNQKVAVHVRRGLINNDIFVSKNEAVKSSTEVFDSPESSLAGIGKPFIAGLLGAFFLLWCAIYLRFTISCKIKIRKRLVVSSLFFAFVFITLFAASTLLEGLPHFQDDLGYFIRSIWLIHGKLTGVTADFNLIGDIPHVYVVDGIVKSIYTIGWPLLMSMGTFIKLPWIVSPILASISAWLIYQLTKKEVDSQAALFALLFFVTSPLVLTLSASMLAHASCAFFIILHQYALFTWRRNSSQLTWLLYSGLALGFAFTIRPLTAIALTIPAAVLFFIEFISTSKKTHCIKSVLVMAASGFVGSLPVWIDNYIVNGSPLIFSYTEGMGHHFGVPEWGKALSLASSTACLLTTNLFGWGGGIIPAWIGGLCTYSLALIPLVVQSKKSIRDISPVVWYSWIGLLSLIGLYVGHNASGMHGYGPRFYYEAIPLLLVASGVGVSELLNIARAQTSDQSSIPLFSVIFIFLLFILPIINLSPRLAKLRGYNSIHRVEDEQVEEDGSIIYAKNWYQFIGLLPHTCFIHCTPENGFVTLLEKNELQSRMAELKK